MESVIKLDSESIVQLFIESVINPHKKVFKSFSYKLDYLMENDYLDTSLVNMHDRAEIELLYLKAKEAKFKYSSIKEVQMFYDKFALRTKEDDLILEDIEDRIVWSAIYLANGDSITALRLVKGIAEGSIIVDGDLFKLAGKVTA